MGIGEKNMRQYTKPDKEEDTTISYDEACETVREMAPAPTLVFKALEYGQEPMTKQDLTEETLLPDRTVRYALNQLDEEKLVYGEFVLHDARKRKYGLNVDFDEDQ